MVSQIYPSELQLDKAPGPLVLTPQTLWRFRLKNLSVHERVWWHAVGLVHQGLTLGFPLLQYSVVCNIESYFCKVFSRIVCTRRCYVDKLGIFYANQTIYWPWSTSELRMGLVPLNIFQSSLIVLLTIPTRCFFCGFFLLFMFQMLVILNFAKPFLNFIIDTMIWYLNSMLGLNLSCAKDFWNLSSMVT